MPLCEGRSDGPGHLIPCPQRRAGSTVRGRQGELMLCDDCNDYRFPACSVSEPVKPKRNTKANAKHEYNTRGRNSSNCERKEKKQSTSTEQNEKPDSDTDDVSCPNCLLPVNSTKDKCVKCGICGESYHQKCVFMSDELYSALTSHCNSDCWACSDCRLSSRSIIRSLQSTVCKLQEEVTNLQVHVINLQQTLNRPSQVHIKYSKVGADCAKTECETSNDSNAGVVHLCHRSIAATTETETVADDESDIPAKVSMIVHKTLASDARRRKNVIVVGLPETHSTNDADMFLKICEENLHVKPYVHENNCVRLGQQSGSTPRRLLVKLNSEETAGDLLRAAKNLRKSCDPAIRQVYINPDLSPYAAKLAYEKRKKRREANLKSTLEEARNDTNRQSPSVTNNPVVTLEQPVCSTAQDSRSDVKAVNSEEYENTDSKNNNNSSDSHCDHHQRPHDTDLAEIDPASESQPFLAVASY